MRQRSNLIILFGVVFFIIGGAIVYLVVNDDDDGGSSGSASSPVVSEITVFEAAAEIPAGTTTATAIADGLLTTRQFDAGTQPVGAITSADQLDNRLFAVTVSEGSPITSAQLQLRSLSNIVVPPGFEGVAIDLGVINAGAGYIAPGDRVNVYGLFGGQGGGDAGLGAAAAGGSALVPRTELLLTNVLVLDVSTQGTTSFQPGDDLGRTNPAGNLTFLLALTTGDAERVIHMSSFADLYLSKPAEDAPNAGDTGGVDGSNVNGPVSTASAEPAA